MSNTIPIARVEARAVAPPVEAVSYTAHEPPVITTTTIVEVTDADGATGMAAYDSDTFGIWDLAPIERLRDILPRLLGRDAADREGA